MNRKSVAGIVLIGIVGVAYADIQGQIDANRIPVERVQSDHDINKPKQVVISLDDADRLYRDDPKAFQKWMQEKWPAVHSSLSLCMKIAQEQVKAQAEKP